MKGEGPTTRVAAQQHSTRRTQVRQTCHVHSSAAAHHLPHKSETGTPSMLQRSSTQPAAYRRDRHAKTAEVQQLDSCGQQTRRAYHAHSSAAARKRVLTLAASKRDRLTTNVAAKQHTTRRTQVRKGSPARSSAEQQHATCRTQVRQARRMLSSAAARPARSGSEIGLLQP